MKGTAFLLAGSGWRARFPPSVAARTGENRTASTQMRASIGVLPRRVGVARMQIPLLAAAPHPYEGGERREAPGGVEPGDLAMSAAACGLGAREARSRRRAYAVTATNAMQGRRPATQLQLR